MVVANRMVSDESLRAEYMAGTRTLDTFREDIIKYQQQLAAINQLPSSKCVPSSREGRGV